MQVGAGSSLGQGDNRNSMASIECALDEDETLIVEVQKHKFNAYDVGSRTHKDHKDKEPA